MNDPNKEGTAKRAYQLQNIEKASTVNGGVQGNSPSSLANTVNAIRTVSDLFAAVKSMDTNFSPNPVSKVVNADGTPMVLHHQTGNEFTVFDPKHSGAGSSDQQTPFGIFMKTSDKNIGVKGDKQAEKHMIHIEKHEKYGWTVTTPTDELLEYIMDKGWEDIDMGRGCLFGFFGGQDTGKPKKGTQAGADGQEMPKKGNSRRYQCPSCKAIVRTTKDLHIICGSCNVDFELT